MDIQKGKGPPVEGEPTVVHRDASSDVDDHVLRTEDRNERVRGSSSATPNLSNKTCSTAFDETDDDEERALTHSLCLAHQCSSERLEELEKECLVEESQRSDSALTMLASEQEQYKPYLPEEFDQEAAFLDRDTSVSETLSDTVTIESGVRASKITSLLLGKILEQREGTILDQRKGSKKKNRVTWASISSQQQSVLDSDRLLRNWTNQCDPLAWDDRDSEYESIVPSDSVSRYHGRSHSMSTVQNVPKVTTFLESTTSASDLTMEERPPLTTTQSADAADRSRRKVAKLTGEDYISITADWMWRMEESTGNTSLVPLAPLEPLTFAGLPKSRKKPKQIRWLNNSTSLTHSNNVDKEIQERLRSTGLI